MSRMLDEKSPRAAWQCTALFAAGYLVCCEFGRLLSFPGVPFATCWPAAGLYLATLTLAKRGDWPRLIGGAVAANLLFDVVLHGRPLPTSLMFCVANLTEASAGAVALTFLRGALAVRTQFRDFVALSAAGMAGATCGACLGSLALHVAGVQDWQAQRWWIWWGGDMVGILLVGPVVLSWARSTTAAAAQIRTPLRILEAIVLFAGVAAATWLVGRQQEIAVRTLPLRAFPLLVWAAARFGTRGTSVALLILFAGMSKLTILGLGPFALGEAAIGTRIVALQTCACLFAFTFLSLSTVIDDRAESLVEAQRSREAAERANAAKRQFLANMSHELRTPMNGILGMTEVVLKSQLLPQQREHLRLVKKSADALLEMLNDILDLSKVEAGRLELRTSVVPLRLRLREWLTPIESQLQDKDVELVSHVDPAIPDELRIDAAKLRQVLLNLLGNAVKFTHHGGIWLDVDLLSERNGQYVLRFCVSDTGIGVSSEVQARIFTPFEQGVASEEYGGTGLGLAIVRQLVSLMGGRVWLESEVGRGSRFHFTIAATPVESSADEEEEAEDSESGIATDARVDRETTAGRSRTVLLAEDDPVNATLARVLLEGAGYEVAVARNGAEALSLWQAGRFDLILSDMRMPVMSGLQFATEIRRHERRDGSRTPIVALTAGAHAADRDACLEAGIDAYLAKPYRTAELLSVVERLTTPASVV